MKRKTAPLPESPELKVNDDGFNRIEQLCNDKVESFESICSQFEQNVLDRLTKLEKAYKTMVTRLDEIEKQFDTAATKIVNSEAKLDKTADNIYKRWDRFEQNWEDVTGKPKNDTSTIDIANSLGQINQKLTNLTDQVKVLSPQIAETVYASFI